MSSKLNAALESPPRFGTEYRTDLQGMRAIAVLLVLAYHAGVPPFTGGFVGVDVFFVLSGFLITGIVAREIQETGRFSLSKFYARRIVRIIPAATIVLIAVAVGSVLWLPITQWRGVAQEIVGSALYFSNWQFAASTNYLNASAAPSPLQHFWSLAVEEQYYLFWPAILLLGIFLLRKRHNATDEKRFVRYALALALLVMAGITVISFAFTVQAMAHWPAGAYFITPTRLWELGVGSLLALGVPYIRYIPAPVKFTLSALGLLAVLGAGVMFNQSTPFPGVTALIPVLGTAAMIAGGLPAVAGPHRYRVLGHPLLVWFGNISYALYLWHWPILILAAGAFGPLPSWAKVFAVALSIIPAYFSTRFIETKFTRNKKLRSSPKKAYVLGSVAVFLSLLAALAMTGALNSQVQPPAKVDISTAGAGSIAPGSVPPPVTAVPHDLTPSLIAAADDNPGLFEIGCHLEVSTTVPVECEFGDNNGPLVMLVGDSHAAQWFPALKRLAQEHHFKLVAMTKSSCPFADVTIELTGKARAYTECVEWNNNVSKYISAEHPAAVVTSTLGLYLPAEGAADDTALEGGLQRSWDSVTALGIPLFSIVDSPYMSISVPDCLASNRSDPGLCRTPSVEAFPHAGLEARAAESNDLVTVIDLNDKICPGALCEPIIGGVLVYRDQHHLTATYSETLSAILGARLNDALPKSLRAVW